MTDATFARQAYLAQQTPNWTRADMLVELYAAAIRHVQNAIEAGRDHDDVNSYLGRLKAVRVIQGIVAGLDLNQGEIPQNISRLCDFVQQALLGNSAEGHLDALRILTTLKEGFEQIRPVANEMQARGEIPALGDEKHFEMRI